MKRLVEENDAWLRDLGAAYDLITCPVLLLVGSRADRVPQGEEIREAVRRGVRDWCLKTQVILSTTCR